MAGKVINFKALSSVLLARSRLANLVGKTYDGDRDLYKYLGYKRVLNFDDFNERYIRGGIATRIVDAYPTATWRNTPSLFDIGEHEEDPASPFVQEFSRMAQRLRLFHYFERVDKLAGVGRYSILLIGVRGATSLERPVPKLNSPDDILFLAPYSEGNADIAELDTDPASPRFGLPLYYSIKLGRDLSIIGDVSGTQERRVHYSRVIHVSEGLLEDEIFGQPRLRSVWNYLDDLDKIVGGGAEAVWRTVDRGIQFDLDPEADLDPDEEDNFVDEIEDYVHNLKRYIKTRGVTAKPLGAESIDTTSTFESTLSLIAGTTAIPQRILSGSERGQLASASDERNFASRVKERQQNYAEPVLLRPFITRCAEFGALMPPDEGYRIKWPDTTTLTAREKADVAARYAQAIKNVATQVQGGREVIPPEDFRKRFIDEGR